MFKNPSDSAQRWWHSGPSDPENFTCASSTADFSTLTKPIPFLLRDGKRPNLKGAFEEWVESGSSPEDEGRFFVLNSETRNLLLYQPRKTETNRLTSLDLVICFQNIAAIQDIRMLGEPILPFTEIQQGVPIVLTGIENAWAVRVRATHPDLRRIPLRFEESEVGLLLVLHLVDLGKERELRDEELMRYSALVTTEEKRLNNPRALEGFEHDLGHQEIWDDFATTTVRKTGFIGDGFKLTGTLDQLKEEWVDRFVIGP